MHELSLCRAIVDTAVRHAGGRPVSVVRVHAGALRQVAPDSLRFSFGFVSKDTVCDGARLELEVLPARLRCGACGHEWELDQPAFRCPSCAAGGVTVVSGDELYVESIEIEEAACTAST